MHSFRHSIAALAIACPIAVGDAAAAISFAPPTQRLDEAFGSFPLTFEPNRGQAPPHVRYLAIGRGYRIHLSPESTVITAKSGARVHSIGMQFLDSKRDVPFAPEKTLASTSNYFGVVPVPLVDIPDFGAVRRDGIYPGVDVVYYGNQQRLEFDFIVNPGADPGVIRIGYTGVEALSLAPNGDLALKWAGGEIVQQRPLVYQEVGGRRLRVEARDEIEDSAARIVVADFDRERPLVIDPVIAYGSGEGGASESYGIAIDAAGNAYVAGAVVDSSTAFPVVSAYDTRIGRGEMDA